MVKFTVIDLLGILIDSSTHISHVYGDDKISLSRAQEKAKTLTKEIVDEMLQKYPDESLVVMAQIRLISIMVRDAGDPILADALETQIDELREIEFQRFKKVS